MINSSAPQDKILEFLDFAFKEQGIRPSQAFPHAYLFNEEDFDIQAKEVTHSFHNNGPVLVALGRSHFDVYKQLWGEELVNFWSVSDWREVTNVIARLGLDNIIEYHLSSPVSTNLFLQLSIDERVEFVQNTLKQFNRTESVQRALSVKPYAPFLLLDLIERDTFMRL
mgnify:CR=1 FL=1